MPTGEKRKRMMTRRRRPIDESADHLRRITYNFNSMMELNDLEVSLDLEGLFKVESNRSTRVDSA